MSDILKRVEAFCEMNLSSPRRGWRWMIISKNPPMVFGERKYKFFIVPLEPRMVLYCGECLVKDYPTRVLYDTTLNETTRFCDHCTKETVEKIITVLHLKNLK